ncbi:MAG: multidrug efflux SMR transporter [Candidatus Methanomethylophilaceae archaeon]|nr:multidrug efflux SMR transporter [Candidatus Methanomethylophilaceae archaeon]MBO7351535.1 multidrug efflux SMR transporter [Candidatus Methanomethylophilaceae archaeon]
MDLSALAWPFLIIAGLMEPMWVYTMERSESFRNVPWSAATVVILVVDIYLLSVAMQTVGAGMSYAVWTGIGAVFTFLMGVFLYKEPVKPVRVILIMMIIAGIVGLNLTSGGA